jgi:hypothetical protein
VAKSKTRDEKDDSPKRPKPVARDGAYVMMLLITFVAIVAGCVFLYLDHDQYGGKSPPKENAPAVQPLGAAAKLEPLPGGTPPKPPDKGPEMPPDGTPPDGMPK